MNLIGKRFLKYIIYFLGITIILMGGTRISFASEVKINSNNGFAHLDDDDTGEGDDDDEEGTHNAGQNCLTSGCHSTGREHRFSSGGTIYTDAEGTTARTGAEIKVIDATGGTTVVVSDGFLMQNVIAATVRRGSRVISH